MGKFLFMGLFLYCKISFLITLLTVTLIIYVWNGSNGSQPTRDSTHFLCTYCLQVFWIQVPPTKRIAGKGSVAKICISQSIKDPYLYLMKAFFLYINFHLLILLMTSGEYLTRYIQGSVFPGGSGSKTLYCLNCLCLPDSNIIWLHRIIVARICSPGYTITFKLFILNNFVKNIFLGFADVNILSI